MKDTIVAYFSGNHPDSSITKKVAKNIGNITGADLFEIQTTYPYSKDNSECVQEALRELSVQARPQIGGPLPKVDEYSTILLGFPNWCGTAPMAIYTFLDALHEQGELAGKRIVPFIINDGGGKQNAIVDLANHYPEAIFDEGTGFIADDPDEAIEEALDWVKEVM